MMSAPDLVNFCIEPFISQATSTSVCADSHTPSNLTALSSSTRVRGFRVERYVRPPVSVCVRLAMPVTVSCLLLCPNLSAQTEMRFDVGMCGGRGSIEQQVYQGTVRGGTDDKDMVLALMNPRMWDRGGVAGSLSSAQVLGGNVGNMLQTACVQECWMRGGPVLAQCRQICVNISRWTGVRPVCLRWVELWGKLATNCSRSERVTYERGCHVLIDSIAANNEPSVPHFFTCDLEATESLHDRSRTEIESSCMRDNRATTTTGADSTATTTGADSIAGGSSLVSEELPVSSNKEKDVPMQLLDEITFEVMEVPMVLPSGRCVDAGTLDKLAAADAACGRPPTDPFTGLAFTDQCRPRFSVHVKGQLDKWQSTCLESSTNRARSVGSSRHIHDHLIRTRRSCSSDEVPASKKPKRAVSHDIGSKFPDRDVGWSLSNHTPFTRLDSDRMNSSPHSNHCPGTSSLTLSLPAFPDASSLASSYDSKSQCSSSTPVGVSLLHEQATTSDKTSEGTEHCPSVTMATSKDISNKSFDCEVEQSLNHALSNIFDCHASTFSAQ